MNPSNPPAPNRTAPSSTENGQRLTIIIPVYNAAPWLRTCLDSLIAQSQPIDEIIAVNDGSTDDSLRILQEYAERLPCLRILELGGGGASGARNAGLDAATGDWVAFVDNDDWVEPMAYEKMLALALAGNLDMALANGRYHFEGRMPDRLIYTDPPLTDVRRGGEWLAHKLENGSLVHMVWMHLYRRTFIESHHLRFTPGITYEDFIWTTQALVLAERVEYIDEPFFVYRKLIRQMTPEKRDKHLDYVIHSYKINAKTLANIAQTVEDPRLAQLIRWKLVDDGLSIFHRIKQISHRQQRRLAWHQT